MKKQNFGLNTKVEVAIEVIAVKIADASKRGLSTEDKEMQNLLKSLEEEDRIENAEIIQLAVSHAERAGDFHLMKAQNPVYIVSFSGKAGKE